MAKALGALPRPWERGQSRGSVAKTVGAWPRTWECGKGRGGVPRPWGVAKVVRGVAKAVGV